MSTVRPRILLTGFNPFSDFGANPTQLIMESIAENPDRFHDIVIRTITLDTSYDAGEKRFREEILDFHPDGIISFGLNFKIDHIALERIAVNLDDAEVADNSEVLRRGEPIAKDGPVGYMATNPIEKMRAALSGEDIPVEVSNHAGAFLCNHIFFCGSHIVAEHGLDTTMGFVHVPPLPELLEASREKMAEKGISVEGRKGMTMDMMLKAADICIRVLSEHISDTASS